MEWGVIEMLHTSGGGDRRGLQFCFVTISWDRPRPALSKVLDSLPLSSDFRLAYKVLDSVLSLRA